MHCNRVAHFKLSNSKTLKFGSEAAGRIRVHTFKRIPPFPRSLIGSAPDDWRQRADDFISTYPSQLNLKTNDCKSFALALSRTLTEVEVESLQDLAYARSGSAVGRKGSRSLPDLLDWI
jgi:hypothetical protein